MGQPFQMAFFSWIVNGDDPPSTRHKGFKASGPPSSRLSWDNFEKGQRQLESHESNIYLLGVGPSQKQWQMKVYRDFLLKM